MNLYSKYKKGTLKEMFSNEFCYTIKKYNNLFLNIFMLIEVSTESIITDI